MPMQWKDDTTLWLLGVWLLRARRLGQNLRAKIEHDRPCLPCFPKTRPAACDAARHCGTASPCSAANCMCVRRGAV